MNPYLIDPQAQKEYSFNRLLRYLKKVVYPYHPYLRKKYKDAGIDVNRIRSYSDFCRLPVVSKADYRTDPIAFILQPTFPGRESAYDTARIGPGFLLRYAYQAAFNRPREYIHLYRKMDFGEGKVGRRAALEWMPIHFHASAGSTGDPTPAVYTFHDFRQVLPELASFYFLESLERDETRPRFTWDKRCFNVFPGTPHLAFFQVVISKMVIGASSFDSCGGKVVPTERQIELFSDGEFNSITAIPSYMVYWLRKAVEMKEAGRVKEMPHLEVAVLGGEPLPDPLLRHIKELAAKLGCHPGFRALNGYGMTESKWAFVECDEGTGIHLHPKFFFWEILHPETLDPVPDGEEGVLVFSHIGWRGTTFVRYNTGDLVSGGIRWERCKVCGHTFPLMFGPIQRAQKDFTKLKGTRVNLIDLIDSVRNIEGVRAFQCVLDKEIPDDEFSRDILRFRVALQPDADQERISADIKCRVKETTEVTPDQIVFEPDAEKLESELFERTGIKADYIVDKRPVHL